MGSSIFFLNVQERGSQSWEKIRRFGFISTAGCPRALDAISEFLPGDTIAAYLPGRGYVGVGVVLNGVRPQTDHADYKLPVRWLRAFDRNEAKWSPRSGLYASPQIKAPISNQPATLRYLLDAFGQDAFGRDAIGTLSASEGSATCGTAAASLGRSSTPLVVRATAGNPDPTIRE